ncbi:MAG: cation:proton antiporter [Planctomycetota bacterium]
MGTPFADIAGVLAVSAAAGAIGLKFRQPLIISFLFAGIFVGPSVFGFIQDARDIELLASIGISLLLFIVGLRLDVGLIRTVGPVALATGLGQVLFTSLIGFGIALAFGMSYISAAYVSVALTFSSTIIIVKLLSDKKEIDSLHGRIAVGFLIVQDMMAILALIALTAFGGERQDRGVIEESLNILGKGLLMVGAIVVLMRWGLPLILKYVSRSQELLVLFAIAWAVSLAAVADALGFSKEVGAFLAGISIASSPQRDAIGARLVVLRDFLLLFFFIHLGATLDLSLIGGEIGRATIFSAFVLIGNPLIVMAIMGWMGYRKRTGFMCGLAVAQISEFSLILAAIGLSLGHISASAMSLITLVGLVTIFASTYMILYSGKIYGWLAGLLSVFERERPYRELLASAETVALDGHWIIMLGLGNYGSAIAASLQQRGWRLLAVDFDPLALERGRKLGLTVVYGDATDPEILEQLPLDKARWALSAIRDRTVNLTLLSLLRDRRFAGRIAMTATEPAHADEYVRRGATIAFKPYSDAADQAVEAISGAVQSLPSLMDWPVSLEELTLQPGSVFAGKTLRDIDIRRSVGASVLAVSRAGAFHFNPNADFRLYPGDRVVLLSAPEDAARALDALKQRRFGSPVELTSGFTALEICVPKDSAWIGKTIADLDFRKRYDATIIGIRRGDERLLSPQASETLREADGLIIVGDVNGLTELKRCQCETGTTTN